MYFTLKLRDALPLLAALALIAAAFLLPPLEADEPEAAAVFAEGGETLIIDAGHGGADGGASAADGTVESSLNLAVARRLEALAGLFGVETLMTRSSEDISYPADAGSLREMKRADQAARLELINSRPGAVLISIHQNYYPDPRPSGPQVFYSAVSGSRALGEAAQALLVEKLCPESRRLASPVDEDIYLMREANCPAILVECGFISNAAELEQLKSGEYQNKLAAVLLTAYLQYAGTADGMVL